MIMWITSKIHSLILNKGVKEEGGQAFSSTLQGILSKTL
jgi:hypothetical protein